MMMLKFYVASIVRSYQNATKTITFPFKNTDFWLSFVCSFVRLFVNIHENEMCGLLIFHKHQTEMRIRMRMRMAMEIAERELIKDANDCCYKNLISFHRFHSFALIARRIINTSVSTIHLQHFTNAIETSEKHPNSFQMLLLLLLLLSMF